MTRSISEPVRTGYTVTGFDVWIQVREIAERSRQSGVWLQNQRFGVQTREFQDQSRKLWFTDPQGE